MLALPGYTPDEMNATLELLAEGAAPHQQLSFKNRAEHRVRPQTAGEPARR